MGAAMTEIWLPVPGFKGAYEVSDNYRIRSVRRVIVRSNGYPYRVAPRVLRPKTHYPSGLQSVTLACGGEQFNVYIHRLVREVFGAAATNPPAAPRNT
jgi:hypothetical protein